MLSPGGTAADFVLQRCDFLFFVKPELEMRAVGLEPERMWRGVGRGLSHSLLFQWEFSFAPLRMLSCFPYVSIVKKFSLGSREHFKKFLLKTVFLIGL